MKVLIALLFALTAVSCKIDVPGTTPAPVAVDTPAVVAPVAAPVVAASAKTVPTAAPTAKPAATHKVKVTSAAERAAFAKAYANAATANQLLGRHAFRTGPNDHVTT